MHPWAGGNCGKLWPMIRATSFAGKKVAVFGMGGSGIAAAHALIAGGAHVVCWDDGEAGRHRAVSEGFGTADLHQADWSQFSSLVLAPGVPLTHPEPHWAVQQACEHGVEIIGDIEVFARERQVLCETSPFIAITGTNGKSTTTALVTHLLRHLGFSAEMGGNIGQAILALQPPAPERVHVVEMSSYQIDLTPTLTPTVGVLLNITPDHIDRHGTLAHYAEVKERLLKHASAAAISLDDKLTCSAAERFTDGHHLYAFTVGKEAGLVPRLYAIGQSLFVHETDGPYATSEEVANLAQIGTLRGQHNIQNALAALAAIKALQDLADNGGTALTARAKNRPLVWDIKRLAEGLASFPGLPHRMEEIGRLGRVLFVNDSKATNAEAAEKALSSFGGGIHWIAGGRAKDGGILSLKRMFPRIERAYLIGEAADEFAATLACHVPTLKCETLEKAVEAAATGASASRAPEPIVLFSPACASFDQYRNFEIRGEAFRNLVMALPGMPEGTDP